MKKTYKLLTAALAFGCLSASAQTVTVMLKDGTSQKFCTDYVKEITFEQQTPLPPALAMTQIDLDVYGSTNASLVLKDAYGDTELNFDLYFPSASYLPVGTYTTDPSASLNIGDDASYSYAKINGVTKTYKEAELVVSNEGPTYTLLVNATLSDDSKINAKYIGTLPAFSQYLSGTMSACKYFDNPQPKGAFVLKMNDANWDQELTLYIFCDAAATTLQAGDYTFADTKAAGTISGQTYFNVNRKEMNPAAGSTVKVALDGSTYTLTMNFITADGLHYDATFTGEITGTPVFESAPAKGPKKAPLPIYVNKK